MRRPSRSGSTAGRFRPTRWGPCRAPRQRRRSAPALRIRRRRPSRCRLTFRLSWQSPHCPGAKPARSTALRRTRHKRAWIWDRVKGDGMAARPASSRWTCHSVRRLSRLARRANGTTQWRYANEDYSSCGGRASGSCPGSGEHDLADGRTIRHPIEAETPGGAELEPLGDQCAAGTGAQPQGHRRPMTPSTVSFDDQLGFWDASRWQLGMPSTPAGYGFVRNQECRTDGFAFV